MRFGIISNVAAISLTLLASTVHACEEYESLPLETQKEYRDKLSNPQADPLDRMFAFEQLVCSENPNLRNYAIKNALQDENESLIRNQVMLRAMMLKNRVDVELGSSKDLTQHDKRFIADNAGVYSKPVVYRSEPDGCLNLFKRSCEPGHSLFVRGDKVEYNYGRIYGEFRLSKKGELVGFLRVADTRNYGRIPAVIKLF